MSVPLPYDSDTEAAEDREINNEESIHRGKGHTYTFVKSYEENPENLVKTYENFRWSTFNRTQTDEGVKKYYRCRAIRGSNCPARLYLLYDATSVRVSLFLSDAEHRHVTVKKVNGIDSVTKNIIKELYERGGCKTPSQIAKKLADRGISQPSKMQINSFLASVRKKNFVPANISLGEMCNWCKDHTNVPNDPDECFVGHYEIDENNDNPQVKIFVTSKTLLYLSTISDHVAVDATHKLVWQGFPVMIIGTTDKTRNFHPFGIAITIQETKDDFAFVFKSIKLTCHKVYSHDYHPAVLIADGSDAITNGFLELFDKIDKRITCFTHVKKMVDSRLKSIKDSVITSEIINDIHFLQTTKSPRVFEKAFYLFKQKWTSKNSAAISDFIEYFEGEWISKNNGWYEGYAIGYPSNNNGLESTNKKLKDLYSFRERLPLNEFLSVLQKDIIHRMSRERNALVPRHINENAKVIFAQYPPAYLALSTQTYEWLRANKGIIPISSSSKTVYYVESEKFGASGTFDRDFLTAYIERDGSLGWSDFEECQKDQTSVWEVTFDCDDWRKSLCTCPSFFKEYTCRHICGVAVKFKLCVIPFEPPLDAKEPKRRRGRIPKIKKALIIQ
ncbi:unnamed protein product [Gordionus sp. m RMFG-2023]